MSPERVRQIEELFHAAREGSAHERVLLLAQADPELRREVESLLSGASDGLFDRPAIRNVPDLLEESTLPGLISGEFLGPYRVESKIGEGGMGEVFRAIDTRLGRAVAIKTAHERFTDRSESEARAISALNHPNICTLHDVGPNYLVMELVEGETLASMIKRGPLPLETALRYASQITAALAEAHGKGIVHRDLKPGNIMIAKSGVKVLDFGLAKSARDNTSTTSHPVMGTPAYISPEQRGGKPADARSDIYSFGCVFYEMVTGAQVSAQRKRVGYREIERVVSRCLEEEPGKRWQSAAELERELARVTTASWGKGILLAAAAIVISLVAGYFYFHHVPKLAEEDTIILADFENKTGDPVFDDTLRQGLSVELQQSPFISLIPDMQITQTLALMGQPKGARLTAEIAQQVCERTASAAILEGSIANLGSQYVVGLRARDCNTGRILDQEQIQAARREDVLNSLSQIARKFRTRVGESLATVGKHSTPLAEATTSSLEALKAYSTADKVNLSSGYAAAIPFFRRAVEIDPKFAMAHAYLGLLYSNVGESVLAAESTAKAWQLRDRVSDRERFFIDFAYDRQVTGNLEEAYQTLELWAQTYPRGGDEPRPQGLLGGLSAFGTGRFESAIDVARSAIASNRGFVLGAYAALAGGYFFLDRFEEADSALQQASEHKVANPDLLVIRYNIEALKGDQVQMDHAIGLAKGKRRLEHWMAHEEALALARSGRLQAARRSSIRAVDLALQEGEYEAAASYRAARAVLEAVYGDAAEGRANAIAAMKLSKGRDVQYAAGLALVLSEASAQSEALADDLENRFPKDTFVQFTYVPVLRALTTLRRGKAAEAVEGLEIARRYELATNGLNFNHFYLGGLHSAYVRGEALVAARRYGEAALEFRKILNHHGLVALDPLGTLANLQLGRAYALSGDNAKAKTAYDTFLTLWKNADADIRILKQAKAEYARLR